MESKNVKLLTDSLYNKNTLNYEKSYFSLVIKRTIDLIGAVIALILFLPLFIFISLLYMFGENKGPILFKQKRVGKNGKLFHIYKFRSMIVDAEKILKNNKELYKKYLDNNYKLEPSEDPRLTKIGEFLRKTSLDELPQIFNVIKGEMSLVGPRPVVTEELKEYSDKKELFLSVKPGVTGYWQISGRSDVGYPERVDLELFYVMNQSIFLDIKILFLTVFQTVLRKGAY